MKTSNVFSRSCTNIFSLPYGSSAIGPDPMHDDGEFAQADVALVIGAKDVVNSAARSNPDSPIYGMPILDVDKAKSVIVVKRGQRSGFSGIESRLFFLDNARMLYLQGQMVGSDLSAAVKQL